ncbi:hypothetical protein FLP10_08080 [Agromyces intestinalis]|uniref:Uncharacterized protein n=1 Tax=Agromyces intestinalis TaxID=2592652 RepID=A0A5C1YE35_9MICO|nr:hypothetical protein [Agromyces intestinalis]QEO14381.1 hypothetical protein FLP10_08080 [Agromyces intestinalis]
MNDVVVTLEPWDPWPLVYPAIAMVLGAVLVFVGVLREVRWARDIGIVALVGGGLALIGLLAFLSGTWDQAQRRDALVELGYEDPTFAGSTGIVGSTTPGDVEFTATLDGESVTGTLEWLGGDRWAVVESQ